MRIKRIITMLTILILAIVLTACGQESVVEQDLPENGTIKEVMDTVNSATEINYKSGRTRKRLS